jgi:hypothetical protein
MRLSTEKIKQGLLHPDRDVRDAVAIYFSRSACRDTSILPLAIQAIEKYGWQHTFIVPSAIEGLPLSDETLLWVLKELHQNNFQGDTIWRGTLSRLLCETNVDLLARHKAEVFDVLDEEDRDLIDMRLDLLNVDTETCWRELDAICSQASQDHAEPDTQYGYSLVEAIARHGDSDRALSALAEKIEDLDDYGEAWMELFMVSLAGEMRLEAAVPHIIAKIKEADEHADLLFEETEQALVKIGTDAAVEGAATLFSDSIWVPRISACCVFQHVHSDLSVAKALQQLPHEKDATIKAWLAQALMSQFAYEGIEPVRQVVLDDDYDRSVSDLRRDLIVATTLMEIELPEKEQWRADLEKHRAEREKQVRFHAEPPEEEYEEEPLPPPKKKIGRNDPCPCGSGKKFKKCCIRKQQESDLF